MRGLLPLLLSVDAQRLIMSMGGVPYLLSPDATGAAACRTVAEPDCAGRSTSRWTTSGTSATTRTSRSCSGTSPRAAWWST